MLEPKSGGTPPKRRGGQPTRKPGVVATTPRFLDPLDAPIRGAAAIARELNLTTSALYQRLKGPLKGYVTRDGARLMTTPRRLLEYVNASHEASS
jgi:hypothetical protein